MKNDNLEVLLAEQVSEDSDVLTLPSNSIVVSTQDYVNILMYDFNSRTFKKEEYNVPFNYVEVSRIHEGVVLVAENSYEKVIINSFGKDMLEKAMNCIDCSKYNSVSLYYNSKYNKEIDKVLSLIERSFGSFSKVDVGISTRFRIKTIDLKSDNT